MTLTVKDNSQLIIPASLQRRAGFKSGDRLEFSATQGVITIAAKPETTLHSADDEYTPQQRRQIDTQLAKGLLMSKRAGSMAHSLEPRPVGFFVPNSRHELRRPSPPSDDCSDPIERLPRWRPLYRCRRHSSNSCLICAGICNTLRFAPRIR